MYIITKKVKTFIDKGIKENKGDEVFFEFSLLIIFFSFLFFWKKTSLILGLLLIFEFFYFIYRRRLLIDKRSILLFVFCLSLRLIGFEKGFSQIVNILIPVLFYRFPILAAYNDNTQIKFSRNRKILYAIICGSVFENMLSICSYIRGIFENVVYVGRRDWYSFFFLEYVPGTAYAFFGVIVSALIVYGAVIAIKKHVIGGLIFFCGIINLFFIFCVVKERTTLIITLISCFISLLFIIYKGQKNYFFVAMIIVVAVLLLGSCFFLFVRNNDIWMRDGGILNNKRFGAQLAIIKDFYKYPLGGEKININGMSAVHNFWFDALYVSGIIPFIFLALFTVLSWKDLLFFIKRIDVEKNDKILFVVEYISIFCYLGVESVIRSSCMTYSIWFMIAGSIRSVIYNSNADYLGKDGKHNYYLMNVVFTGLSILYMLCVLFIYVIPEKGDKKYIYGDYPSAREFVRTIDCFEFLDKNKEKEYLVEFDIRSNKEGIVEFSFFGDEFYSKYYAREKIVVLTDYEHVVLNVKPTVIGNGESEKAYITFAGEWESGVVPIIKNLSIKLVGDSND